MKNIGIICEGGRDYDMITAVIDCFLEEENNYWLARPFEYGVVAKLL